VGKFVREVQNDHSNRNEDLENVDTEATNPSQPSTTQVQILSTNTQPEGPFDFLDAESIEVTGRLHGLSDSHAENITPRTRSTESRNTEDDTGNSDASASSIQLANQTIAAKNNVATPRTTPATVDARDKRRQKRDKLHSKCLVARGSSTNSDSRDSSDQPKRLKLAAKNCVVAPSTIRTNLDAESMEDAEGDAVARVAAQKLGIDIAEHNNSNLGYAKSPFVFLFRAVYVFLHISTFLFCKFCDCSEPYFEYWLANPYNSTLRSDITYWVTQLTARLLMTPLYGLHVLIQWLVYVPQAWILAPFLWWLRFYWHIFNDPRGRSLYEIFSNPRLEGNIPRSKPRVSRETYRRYVRKGRVKIRPSNARYAVDSSYQVHGAYAHLGSSACRDLGDAINAASTFIHFDDPLRISVPYNYLASKIDKPPDNQFTRALAFTTIVVAFAWSLLKGFSIITATRALRFMESMNHLGCVSDSALLPPPSEEFVSVSALTTDTLTDQNMVTFDTDGTPFVIDNSATCIICNVRDFFIGELEDSDYEVTTSNNSSRPQKKGTIRLSIADDAGVSHTYEIPNAIYDPDSPFNILGVPFFGKFLGTEFQPDEETWVKSSTTKSQFVWDHGKHERHFSHSANSLPELNLNTGFGYFHSFCNRVRNIYSDHVHYSFSTATALANDARGISKYTSSDASRIKNAMFRLGMSVLYKPGDGASESVVYEGASEDGITHFVRHSDGTRSTTTKAHIRLLDQADLTNIPKTPLEYCREVGKGLTQDEAQRLACPQTLTPLQQELLSWHHRLYHLPFGRIFKMCELGYLPHRLLACKKSPPVCIACQFGTAHRRPWRFKGKKSGSIRRSKEKNPGDGTSVDQIVSAQPGVVPQMHGQLTKDRIWGATVFVDHVSDYVYVHLMKDLTLEATLTAKKAYEKILTLAGHTVKAYRADNGRFADKGFHDACTERDQTIDFCGVGAHHQNGIVENRNKQLTLGARTLLLEGMRKWPQMIDTMFWPFALKAQAERMNALHLDIFNRTPESKLYNTTIEELPVGNYHPLFCPVYVLDHRLHNAGGAGPPKWEPRSRMGVYCGHSPFHAGNVALVFNPKTGLISPQYHVVFDDEFSTVPYMERGEVPPHWPQLCKYSTELSTDEEFSLSMDWLLSRADVREDTSDPNALDDPPITRRSQDLDSDRNRITSPFDIISDQSDVVPPEHDVSPLLTNHSQSTSSTTACDLQQSQAASEVLDNLRETNGVSTAVRFTAEPSTGPPQQQPGVIDRRHQEDGSGFDPSTTDRTLAAASSKQPASGIHGMPVRVNLQTAGCRRSPRLIEQEKRAADPTRATSLVTETNKKRKAHVTFGTNLTTRAISLFALLSNVQDNAILSHTMPRNATPLQRFKFRLEEANELVYGTFNCLQHFAFTTDIASNEVFTYHQACKQPDWHSFFEAMEKEIADHESRDHWTLVERSSMPRAAQTIRAIWSFKRKRFPDGRLNKHKARLCAHGGMQRWGENYWETYSPVVNMLSVKLLLIIAKIHGLDSKSIDFVLAFPQADLDVDIWMELPLGFEPLDDPGNDRKYVLKLNKNLYGLKQASYNWYEKLKTGLMDRGFKPSQIDPCLYLKKGMIVLTYVDDCIIVGDSMKDIDSFVTSMSTGPENFKLTDEGDIDKFLGIEIKNYPNGHFELSQPFLIDRVIKYLSLDGDGFDAHVNSRLTPAAGPILNKDVLGKPRKQSWKYRTAVGMLTYLQSNSRPDISMPTHQTARFCAEPMRSHEQAITRIGRYLLHSKTRGIVYRPDISKGLECYVDADFAGGWNDSDPHDCDNLYSRTGFVIKYGNCPIFWSSKLQTEIALSTAEAEYIALSTSLREVIPLITLLREIHELFPLLITPPTFHCKVWEDNQSCISMATTQKFTPRTKHIALKYHHFRKWVQSKQIEIQYVRTEDQEADILTKPVKPDLFFPIRHLLMGW